MHAGLSLLLASGAALVAAANPINAPYEVTDFIQHGKEFSLNVRHPADKWISPFIATCSGIINKPASDCSVISSGSGRSSGGTVVNVTTQYTHQEAGGHVPHLNARKVEFVVVTTNPAAAAAAGDDGDGDGWKYWGLSNWIGRDVLPGAFNGTLDQRIAV